MSPEEFRRHGHAVVDWIAGYYEGLERLPVGSRVTPGQVRAALPEHPPEQGEPFDAVLADLDRVIVPGLTHWQHPAFFGYFPANASFPAILGDLLSAGLGVQGMLWATSPACTELEALCLDWLAELLDLPAAFRSTGAGGGVIQDTASTATLTAMVAAVHRASRGAASHAGAAAPYLVYTSAEAHSSVEKAVRIAGLGTSRLRLIETAAGTGAMDAGLLQAAMDTDRAAGGVPALVVATVGTTSTGAVDPVRRIGQLCREHGAWLHVDAAYAGVAAVCPEFRWLLDGLELADSFCTNPHKWLLTNFDCDAFYVADRQALVGALSILPEYLRNAASESGAVVDYRDWQLQLGRRFRALKLWSVLRWYGTTGLQRHLRGHVALAQEFAALVSADDRFEIVAPHPLSLVCFRLRATAAATAGATAADTADAANAAVLAELNAGGRAYLTHTRVGGRYTLRLAVGSPLTQRRHIWATWAEIRAIADRITAPAP